MRQDKGRKVSIVTQIGGTRIPTLRSNEFGRQGVAFDRLKPGMHGPEQYQDLAVKRDFTLGEYELGQPKIERSTSQDLPFLIRHHCIALVELRGERIPVLFGGEITHYSDER